MKQFGCGTCERKESKEVMGSHLAWDCKRHPGLEEYLKTMKYFCGKPDNDSKLLLTQEQE